MQEHPSSAKQIVLKKVAVHNLQQVDLTLEAHKLIVFTGVSGSGKSSLAFDTIYVEGQRRYIESLPLYVRRQLGDFPKPEAELISGISPTIAIEQKTSGRNPRSTVGTLTGIYDYLRILFARVATPHCPISKEPVCPQSTEQILQQIRHSVQGKKIVILSPYAKNKKGEFKEDFFDLVRKGFTRIRLDGQLIDLSEEYSLDGHQAHDIDIVIDRLVLESSNDSRLIDSVSHALELGKGMLSVLEVDTGKESFYSQHAFSPLSGESYGPLEPTDFSFNHPSGMCPQCQGLGKVHELDYVKSIDEDLSIREDCCKVAGSYQTVRWGNIYDNLARLYGFSVTTPWKKLPEKAKRVFLYGTEKKWTRMEFIHPVKKTRWSEYVQWRGVLHEAKERYQEAKSASYRQKMEELLKEKICPSCQGDRIKPYPAAARLGDKKISEITALPVEKALAFFETLRLTPASQVIAQDLVKEIKERIGFLKGVGLHYLTLDRTAPTLSGGESQRVRLASQIGSGLVGATYILDEPSIGLHPIDNTKLIGTLKSLRDKGNTVIVVEHDEETIRAADYIVDVGPLAGKEGGKIVAEGDVGALINSPDSVTGAYLARRLTISSPSKKRPLSKKHLLLEGATHHNLKNLTVKIPLQRFVAVTGVSGSGKSSLITDILYPALSNALHKSQLPVGEHTGVKGVQEIDKVVAIDQVPLGRTPRSNPATYIKLFDEIRDLFSQLPESLARGYSPGRFSFNVKEGTCLHCSGMGMVKVNMDFMDEEWVLCTECQGKRFDPLTLSILYKGKSIYDVLEMTVAEAYEFFAPFPKIKEKLKLLTQVGLGYMRIGQPSPTLSGGEAQRIKLAKELSRPSTGNTIYILDEPTTGLHFHDMNKLIQVLHTLVDRGNTVVVIEHNMDLVKTADWILELGPEGGEGGGRLIAEGRLEAFTKLSTPTALSLQKIAHPQPLPKKAIKAPSVQPVSLPISIEDAAQNNLKNLSLHIPRNQITICTGPSGSGKSSLAFETIYAEGQRRYIESLSTYARQFVKQMPKPKVGHIEGLSASIAIEQKSHAGNPRSTVGTMTEAYDFLRVLFAHLGTAYCPETGEEIKAISKGYVAERLLQLPPKTKLYILAPLSLRKNEDFAEKVQQLQRQGFLRLRLNQEYFELDEPIPFEKQRKNEIALVIDRFILSQENAPRLREAIEKATEISGGMLIADKEGEDLFFNLAFAVEKTGKSYPPITPHTFSFNTSHGMCPECLGLGFQYGADLARHRSLMKLSCADLIELLWKDHAHPEVMEHFYTLLGEKGIDPDLALQHLSSKQLQFFFNGEEETSSSASISWKGVNSALVKISKASTGSYKQTLLPLLEENPCFSCQGTRLHPLARHVRLKGLSIADVCHLSIEETLRFISKLTPHPKTHAFLIETVRQLKHRLEFLLAIGLGYLSLDRSAPSLSGGESQRIRLARQLGSGLTGCIYVLDEPSIGLHPQDNHLLSEALRKLCNMGNTLILVEHDPLILKIADHILDFGPQAGKRGGQIIAQGTLQEIQANPASLTGAYSSGCKKIPLPSQRRKPTRYLEVEKAKVHNLKNLTVSFPIGVFTCVTGVSGSGKSTLVLDLVRQALEQKIASGKTGATFEIKGATVKGLSHFDKLIVMDQNPIGHTNRADVSTYVDLLTPLRHFFAALPEAKIRGLQPKHFSFNHLKGMCTRCWGLGTRYVNMQFLPPLRVPCDSCQGYRLNPNSLEVSFKGKHLGKILQMSIEEAQEWLPALPKLKPILETLIAVGLGYLQLGQEIATLSGGESQRLRLSRELIKRSTGKTLYLLDEPTVGLHSEDILKLLPIFQSLVDKGNTLIIIEHNQDIVASADYLIDLGPGAGDKGGTLVTCGTPEEVSEHPHSSTGKFLKPYLRFLKGKSAKRS